MVHSEVSALRVQGLCKQFRKSDGQIVDALVDLNLRVEVGECVSVIGESGSGKSTLARILMGLEFADHGVAEVSGVSPRDAAKGRGDGGLAVVLQDPADALDPRYRVFSAISEPLVMRSVRLSKEEIRQRVMDAMAAVGLQETVVDSRVSRLSGGQQQRVGIARALVTNPALLILDEPTSALDPSVQAQILRLLENLQESRQLSVLLITHDLAVAAYLGDRICVLRHGRLVEVGTSEDLWRRPQHPYTQALMSASSFEARLELDSETDVETSPTGEIGVATENICDFVDICGEQRAAHCPGAVSVLKTVGGEHMVVPHCRTLARDRSQNKGA